MKLFRLFKMFKIAISHTLPGDQHAAVVPPDIRGSDQRVAVVSLAPYASDQPEL